MTTTVKSNISTRSKPSDVTTRFNLKEDDFYEKWRPPPGIRYNLSETNINIEAVLPKVNLKYTTVNYDPGQDLSVPESGKGTRYAKPRGRGPVFVFTEEKEYAIWREWQDKFMEKFLKDLKERHKKIKAGIQAIHDEIIHSIGPSWYHELSPNQMESADSLKDAMAIDHKYHTISNTQGKLGSMGLVLWPNHTKVAYALKKFYKCPVEFLLTLVRLNRPKPPVKKTTYTLNDRIMLSAVVHLSIRETFRELHLRIPSPPRSRERTQICPPEDYYQRKKLGFIQRSKKSKSPYLRRMVPVIQYHKKEVYMNRHKEWPYLEYFDYVDDMYVAKWIDVKRPATRRKKQIKESIWSQPPKIPVRLIQRQIKQKKIYELKKPSPYISPCKMKDEEEVEEEEETKEVDIDVNTSNDIVINTNIDLDNLCCCAPSSFNENTTFDLKIRITTSDEELNLIQKLCPYNPNKAIGDLKLVQQKKIDGVECPTRGRKPEDKPIKKIEYSCECCTCGKTINICPELSAGTAAQTIDNLKKLKEHLPEEATEITTPQPKKQNIGQTDEAAKTKEKDKDNKEDKDKKAKAAKKGAKTKDPKTQTKTNKDKGDEKSTKETKTTKEDKQAKNDKSTKSTKSKQEDKSSETAEIAEPIPDIAKPHIVEAKPEIETEETKIEDETKEATEPKTEEDKESIKEIKSVEIKKTKSGRPMDEKCTCQPYSSSSSTSTDVDDPYFLCTCKVSSDSCVCCTCGELDPDFLLKIKRFNEANSTKYRPCTCDCKCQSKKPCCGATADKSPCKYCFCAAKLKRAEAKRRSSEDEERRRRELEDEEKRREEEERRKRELEDEEERKRRELEEEQRRLLEEEERLRREKAEQDLESKKVTRKYSLKTLRRLSSKHEKRKSSSSSKTTTPSSQQRKPPKRYSLNVLRRLSAKHEKRKSESEESKRRSIDSKDVATLTDSSGIDKDIKECKCDKLYAQYLDAHESCMSLFSHYQKKIEQDIKDYLEDIKTNRCLCGDSDDSSEKEMDEQAQKKYLLSLLKEDKDACKCDDPKPNPCTCGCTGDLAHPFAGCTCGVDHAGCTCNQSTNSSSDSNSNSSGSSNSKDDNGCCSNCQQGPCTCQKFVQRMKKKTCPMTQDHSDDDSGSNEEECCCCKDTSCKCGKFVEKVKQMKAAAKEAEGQNKTEDETSSETKRQQLQPKGGNKSPFGKPISPTDTKKTDSSQKSKDTYAGFEEVQIQEDLEEEEEEEKIYELDPRIFVLDKFPNRKKRQMQLLRVALGALAEDGYPLAKLPDVHRLPHFKVWLDKRSGKFIPMSERNKYMKYSVDFWNHIEICPGTKVRNPVVPIPKELLHITTWSKVLTYRKMIDEVMTNFRRKMKQKYIDKAQEFFPTTYSYEFYTKSFRQCFFSYLPADENHIFVFKPWMLSEKKNMSSRKPC